jgi:hypothetical protein
MANLTFDRFIFLKDEKELAHSDYSFSKFAAEDILRDIKEKNMRIRKFFIRNYENKGSYLERKEKGYEMNGQLFNIFISNYNKRTE